MNQLRPWDSAGRDVDDDAAPDRPLLQVFSAERRVETQPVTGAADAVTEVDILDAGARKTIVESADFAEHMRPYRAETRPEGPGLTAAKLVDTGM